MFRSTVSKAVKAALLGSVFLVASTVSLADALGNETVSVKVTSAGLDLHSAAGARSMLVRLEVAAEQACGVEAEFDALRAAQFRQCYNHSLSSAVRALSQPLVTHLYAEHYPREATQFGIVDDNDYAAVR
jgi:UrcA family protein